MDELVHGGVLRGWPAGEAKGAEERSWVGYLAKRLLRAELKQEHGHASELVVWCASRPCGRRGRRQACWCRLASVCTGREDTRIRAHGLVHYVLAET